MKRQMHYFLWLQSSGSLSEDSYSPLHWWKIKQVAKKSIERSKRIRKQLVATPTSSNSIDHTKYCNIITWLHTIMSLWYNVYEPELWYKVNGYNHSEWRMQCLFRIGLFSFSSSSTSSHATTAISWGNVPTETVHRSCILILQQWGCHVCLLFDAGIQIIFQEDPGIISDWERTSPQVKKHVGDKLQEGLCC